MVSEKWTRENLMWVSGILEGEGTFYSYLAHESKDPLKENRKFCVSMGTTDEDVAIKLFNILNIGKLYGPYIKRINTKPLYFWKCAIPEDCYALMIAIFEFMCNRRKEKIHSVCILFKEYVRQVSCGKYERFKR